MTASNGQHRSLSAAAAARKYEYVFPGFSTSIAAVAGPCQSDHTQGHTQLLPPEVIPKCAAIKVTT